MRPLFITAACLVAMVTIAPFPQGAVAHGSGSSLEKVVGEYAIDIGYEPEFPAGGERLVLDFNLLDKAAKTAVPFDDVWVRLEHAGKTLLATGVRRADIGATSLLYSVPSDVSGDLKISVRYQKEQEELAKAEFVLVLGSAERQSQVDWQEMLVPGFGGLLLGAAAVFAFMRRKLIQ